MSDKKLTNNPFGWDELEQRGLTSFYTQRQASYKECAQENYTGNAHEAFFNNVEAPTPNIAEIDGYKSEKEISEETSEAETPETEQTPEVAEPDVKEEEKDGQTEPQPEEVKE